MDPEKRYQCKVEETADFRLDEENFKSVLWENTEEGQEVFLKGTVLGRFRAYGPHEVEDKDRRTLKNQGDTVFLHYSEELLVKVFNVEEFFEPMIDDGMKALDHFKSTNDRSKLKDWLERYGETIDSFTEEEKAAEEEEAI